MSLLTLQLERLNEEKLDLEKRIEEEKQKKIKLNNTASIEQLEALVQPLTEELNKKERFKPSRRETLETQYKLEIQLYNNRLITNHTGSFEQRIPPAKNKELVEEEIYTTIIGILKKQEQEIQNLKQQLNQK